MNLANKENFWRKTDQGQQPQSGENMLTSKHWQGDMSPLPVCLFVDTLGEGHKVKQLQNRKVMGKQREDRMGQTLKR